MANFFKGLIPHEPASLNEIRDSLDAALANDKDIIDVLSDHHDFLNESISVLMDKDSSDLDKQFHLIRFFRLVEMHGKAEQETLYVHLRQNKQKEARLEGFGGQDEHDIAFQLEHELLKMGYLTNWNEEIAAKAKVAAGLVKNHIKEEESFMFPIAQRDLSGSELESMCVDYLIKCKTYFNQPNPAVEDLITLRPKTNTFSHNEI